MVQKENKVLLIYTGGTIGMGRNPLTGALEPLDFNHLRDNVPEMKYIKATIDIYQFEQPIDSSDIDPATWARLVKIINENYQTYTGFVILHGTDTMAYTASALSFMLENLTKPVILTGSQLPIGQLRTDGKENLVTSIELASLTDDRGRALIPEVCIYFSGKVLRGNRATKQNADEFNAFDTFNYPHLCEAGINFTFNSHHILKPFPGIQENVVRHLIDAPELKGIILRSYGSGNAPQQPWLIRLLREATERGVSVVNISQCISGQVEMGRYNTGYQLKDAGVISGYDSTVEAATTKLMHLYAKYDDINMIRKQMNESIAGEISKPIKYLPDESQ